MKVNSGLKYDESLVALIDFFHLVNECVVTLEAEYEEIKKK